MPSRVLNSTFASLETALLGPLRLDFGIHRPVLTPAIRSLALSSVAQDLLLYDEVVLHARNFDRIIDLALFVDDDDLLFELLRTRALSMTLVNRAVGFAPPTLRMTGQSADRAVAGLTQVGPGEGQYAVDEAISTAMTGRVQWGKGRALTWRNELVDALDTSLLDQNVVLEAIEETEHDLQNADLIAAVGISEKDLSTRQDSAHPVVARLIELVHVNEALGVATRLDIGDLHAQPLVAEVIELKLRSVRQQFGLNGELSQLVDHSELPDPSVWAHDRDAFRNLLGLRTSASGVRFRQWLQQRSTDPAEGISLLQDYIADLRFRTRPPSRPTRILTSSALSVAGSVALMGVTIPPLLAIPAGVAASLLVEESFRAGSRVFNAALGRGWRPSAFIDDDLATALENLRPGTD